MTLADPARAGRVLVLLGVVAMFGDMTYEGARSVSGPWLTHLGASAAAVGVVAGVGEALGQGLRLLTGRLADATAAYWTLTALGYAVNLVAIPGLAWCGAWPAAAALVLLERIGKAVRGPARSVLVADASHHVGVGRGFAIEEVLDQLGAVSGPLLVAAAAARAGGAPAGLPAAFLALALPAALALVTLGLARAAWGRDAGPPPEAPAAAAAGEALGPAWRRVVLGGALLGAATADWALVAVHLGGVGGLAVGAVPLVYAGAMATDAAGAWASGVAFDRRGPRALVGAALAAALAAPLVFLGSTPVAVAGALVWGAGLGAQESTLKAAVARAVPRARRGQAYGTFAAAYGLAWAAGSAAFGLLYAEHRPALVALAMALAAAAGAVFALAPAGPPPSPPSPPSPPAP